MNKRGIVVLDIVLLSILCGIIIHARLGYVRLKTQTHENNAPAVQDPDGGIDYNIGKRAGCLPCHTDNETRYSQACRSCP